jgi:hypothetical protein
MTTKKRQPQVSPLRFTAFRFGRDDKFYFYFKKKKRQKQVPPLRIAKDAMLRSE